MPARIAFSCFRRDDEAVHDRVHVLDVRRLQLGLVGDVDRLAVDDQAPAAFLSDLGEHEVQVLAVDLEDRRAQLDLGALGQREDGLEDLARRPARRRLARARTMRLADRGEEQVQIAGDVRHRADGRSRVAADGLLLDRDDRRQTEHEVDVGLGHLRHEALGVARERLHVAALSLGVDGVEGQARLAGAGEAGDDDQAVARDFHRDVLQVVHPRALHGNSGPHPAVFLRRAAGATLRLTRHRPPEEEGQLLQGDGAALGGAHGVEALAISPDPRGTRTPS